MQKPSLFNSRRYPKDIRIKHLFNGHILVEHTSLMDSYYVLLSCKPCVEAVDLSRGEASFFFYCPVFGANHFLCHLKKNCFWCQPFLDHCKKQFVVPTIINESEQLEAEMHATICSSQSTIGFNWFEFVFSWVSNPPDWFQLISVCF